MKAKSYMRPGPGWKHLNGSVWEHSSGVRIHAGGSLVRDAAGKVTNAGQYTNTHLRKFVKINGGNRKRGLMAYAVKMVKP